LLTTAPNLTTKTNAPDADLEPAQQAHLARLLARIQGDLTAKYAAGQREHGGSLWLKPGMLECAIEEALDLLTYLYTALEQRDEGFIHNGRDE
jgi:hypothetical protein